MGARILTSLHMWSLALLISPGGAGTAQTKNSVTIGAKAALHYLVRYEAPPYPTASLKLKSSGVVVADIEVDERGHVRAVRIIRAPDNRIADVTTKTIKKWLFRPIMVDGMPHLMHTSIYIYFFGKSAAGTVVIAGLEKH